MYDEAVAGMDVTGKEGTRVNVFQNTLWQATITSMVFCMEIGILTTERWLLLTQKRQNILKADIVPALGSGRSRNEYMA